MVVHKNWFWEAWRTTAAVEASERAASLLSRLPSRQLTIGRARTGFPLSTEQGEIYFHSWPEFENTCLDKSLRLVGGLEKRWWWMIVEECCQPSKCRPPSTGCQKSGLCNSWSNKPMPVSILYFQKLPCIGGRILFCSFTDVSLCLCEIMFTNSTYLPLVNWRWNWLILFTFSQCLSNAMCGSDHKLDRELLTLGGSAGYWEAHSCPRRGEPVVTYVPPLATSPPYSPYYTEPFHCHSSFHQVL